MYRKVQMTHRFGMLALSICLLAIMMFTTSQARAATIPLVKASCAITLVAGHTEVESPFVRVQISPADNLTQVLASRIVPVNQFGSYVAALTYTPQTAGSLLVISVGEWDGTSYLLPATIVSRPCKAPRR